MVDIGAQVAGRIVSFGKDKNGKEVDYGSVVEAGTVLARIDDALYAADAAAAKAQLAQAKAAVQKAEADLGQLQAKLFQTESDWARAQKLGPSDALSQTDFDAARAAYEVAKANLAVGKAAIVQAQGTVAQAEAVLKRALQNLSYCTIVSPVKGVIIDRRVNIGQTVVASLNAPSLFLIAKDLKRLQVWVSVNEADIGRIKPGQPVTFTVDAYPGEVFPGEVGKVRLNATMTQNVVTYTVEIITDNSERQTVAVSDRQRQVYCGRTQECPPRPQRRLALDSPAGAGSGRVPGERQEGSGARGATPGQARGQGRQGGASPRRRLGPPGNPGAPGLRRPSA